MKINLRLKSSFLLLLAMALTACSSVMDQPSNQITIGENTDVQLPRPNQLGYDVTASQLIKATWTTQGQIQTRQLPVQLQVTGNQITLAGFSSWGTRILSLKYQDNQLTTQVLSGLKDVLPPPQQILFNLMLTLWPADAWEASLNKINWHIVDQENQRIVLDDNGIEIIGIRYNGRTPFTGDITFSNHQLGYTVDIQTLNYQQQ